MVPELLLENGVIDYELN